MTITKADLAHFTGSETFYRHSLMRSVTYTEGVQFLAEKAGAYWLVDKVATLQLEPEVRREEFQVWKLWLDRSDNSKATLVCEDGNDKVVYRETIDFTDFPLDEITLYFVNNVIMLPSEY